MSEFAESLWVHGSDVLRSEVHLKSAHVRKHPKTDGFVRKDGALIFDFFPDCHH